MAVGDHLVRGAKKLGSEGAVTSPLPPPSPTGYEHCFITRRNRGDDDSESAPFTTKVISYLPTRPQTLPLDATDISTLTRSQRDVLHHILEDRNGRTEEDGLWVLVGLLGAGATSDAERPEDFEISIMFCEYGASVDPHFDHSKRFYLSTTSTGKNKDKARAREPQESSCNGHWEEGKITDTKMGKEKRGMGREYANLSQGQNSRHPVPDKDISLPYIDNSTMQGTVSPQTKDQSPGGEGVFEDSGRGSWFSATLEQLNESFGGNSDRKRVPRSEIVSPSGARQMDDEIGRLSSPSPLLVDLEASDPPCEASSGMNNNRSTTSVLSDFKYQLPSQGSEPTETERLPTLTSSQLANMHNWAIKLRNEGDSSKAISLFRIVWYCRAILIGPSHPWTINTMQHLAATCEKIGHFQKAASLREALEARDPESSPKKSAEPAPAPTASELLEVQQWAVELRRQRAFNRSILLFTIVWYAWDTLLGEGHGNSRTVMNELALTYDANRQPDMAKRLRDELDERRQRNKFLDKW